MKPYRPFWIFLVAALSLSALGSQGPSATQLLIIVQLPDGSPAAGVKIQQVQLERTSPRPRNTLCGTTDSSGQLVVRFLPMRSEGDDRNGYGLYRFVLMPDNFRWELSDIYYWNKEPWSDDVFRESTIWSPDVYQEQMRAAEARDTNWCVGSLYTVAEGKTVLWKVTLKPGRAVQVAVTDQFSQPVANRSFSVFLDTGVLSHTGSGGEIPIAKFQSDAGGIVTLPRAGDFWYSFEYLPTGQWTFGEYYAPGKPYFTLVVTGRFDQAVASLKYSRYVFLPATILVRDKATQRPISGAVISNQITFSSATQGGILGQTDAEGRYVTDKFFTEHVFGLTATKDGYKDCRFDIRNFVVGNPIIFEMEPKQAPR
jgi:hypothetical protein